MPPVLPGLTKTIRAGVYAPRGRQGIASSGYVSTRRATILAPSYSVVGKARREETRPGPFGYEDQFNQVTRSHLHEALMPPRTSNPVQDVGPHGPPPFRTRMSNVFHPLTKPLVI